MPSDPKAEFAQRYDELPVGRSGEGREGTRKELLSLRTPDGAAIDAALYRPQGAMPKTGLVWIHPQVGFLHHYAMAPLAARGFAALGLNSRYVGNESSTIAENVVLDMAAGVRWLREHGCRHVVVVGNSGGGAIACVYQSQAESPVHATTPAGDPPDLGGFGLAPADAVILLNAHPGRAEVLTGWLDPAVVDETRLDLTDSALDMYDARNGPPYAPDWLERYRAAQLARNHRITLWVEGELEKLAALEAPARDFPFVVHRTAADPRFLDLSIDPSDRAPGTYWGDPCATNYMLGGLGRVTSLRSWLSQWSVERSQCSALKHLPRITAPVLVLQSTADQGVFKSDAEKLHAAATSADKRLVWLDGSTHFFKDQPEKLAGMIEAISGWLGERGL